MKEIDWEKENKSLSLDKDKLGQVAELANDMLSIDKQIEDIESALEDLRVKRKTLANGEIPELMNALGLVEFKTDDGVKLQLTKFYSAKISDENKEEAFAWLKSTNNDSIIKSEINARFGKGEEETRQETRLVELLDSMDIPYGRKRSVHPSTLKAFVKEQVETSVAGFPRDLFGVFIGDTIKIGKR